MARPLRLSYENAVYHITARGNRKESIYYSDNDRRVFLDKLGETYPFQLKALLFHRLRRLRRLGGKLSYTSEVGNSMKRFLCFTPLSRSDKKGYN